MFTGTDVHTAASAPAAAIRRATLHACITEEACTPMTAVTARSDHADAVGKARHGQSSWLPHGRLPRAKVVLPAFSPFPIESVFDGFALTTGGRRWAKRERQVVAALGVRSSGGLSCISYSAGGGSQNWASRMAPVIDRWRPVL
eukprot:scaffold10178_cov129-Isochrysis_galbana.AAC.4